MNHSPNCSEERNCPLLQLPNEVLLDEVAALLADGRRVSLRVKGQSMHPFLVEGRDVVCLQRLPMVEVGDIVLARIPRRGYVLHGVYACAPHEVVLMGDGNVNGREVCSPEAVCGTVVEVVHRGKGCAARSAAARRWARWWRWCLPLRRYLLAA